MNGYIIALLIWFFTGWFFSVIRIARNEYLSRPAVAGQTIGVTLHYVGFIFLLYMAGALK